jgi:DNA-binding response OmpR family regulator
MLRPSGLLTVRRAVEVVELLSRQDDPPFPVASAIVVDRDQQEVQIVIEAMKNIEFQLFCAEESRPALETLAGEHHDLILLDWQGSASILDVQHIRTMPRHHQTPIIFLANAESEEPARLVGDDVLIKPLIASEIALKVAAIALTGQLSNEASGSVSAFS